MIILAVVSAVVTAVTLIYRWAQTAPLTDYDVWCAMVDEDEDAKQARTGSS